MEQPHTWFGCHAKPESVCTGWLHTVLIAPPGWDSLGLRLLSQKVDVPDLSNFKATVEMFDTGTEACEHGMRDIDAPGPEAQLAMFQLRKMIETR